MKPEREKKENLERHSMLQQATSVHVCRYSSLTQLNYGGGSQYEAGKYSNAEGLAVVRRRCELVGSRELKVYVRADKLSVGGRQAKHGWLTPVCPFTHTHTELCLLSTRGTNVIHLASRSTHLLWRGEQTMRAAGAYASNG